MIFWYVLVISVYSVVYFLPFKSRDGNIIQCTLDIATSLQHGGWGRYRQRGRYLCNARAPSSIGVEVAIASAAAISKVAISNRHCINNAERHSWRKLGDSSLTGQFVEYHEGARAHWLKPSRNVWTMEEDHNISAEGHKQSQETEILQYLPNQKVRHFKGHDE